ncbi:MAG: GtrA family protein [Pseudorhizobium sp.]
MGRNRNLIPLRVAALVRQARCFALVGLLATIVHIGVFAALSQSLGIPPLISNSAAFLLAFSISFAGQAAWTFRAQIDDQGLTMLHLVRFVCTSLVGFGINSLIVYVIVIRLAASSLFALPLMATLAPAAVFALNKWWVFRQDGQAAAIAPGDGAALAPVRQGVADET